MHVSNASPIALEQEPFRLAYTFFTIFHDSLFVNRLYCTICQYFHFNFLWCSDV